MPSAAFVFEHLIAAQTRLDEAAAKTAAKLSTKSTTPATTTAKATATTTVAKEKKFLSVFKKIVQ